MKIELNALVTVRLRGVNKTVSGTVVNYNTTVKGCGVVHLVDAKGDQYKVFEAWDDITVYEPEKDAAATNIKALENLIEEVGYFAGVDGYGDGNEMVYFCEREHSEYIVVLAANAYGYHMNTIHKGRKHTSGLDSATANETVVKTIRGVKGFVARFA